MDQRREPRFVINQPVGITALEPKGPRQAAMVKDSSGRGLGIEVTQPFSVGAAVRIDLEDALLLGEVMYCRPEKDGYLVGVELDQMLSGLAELNRACYEFTEQPQEASVRTP